jgi:hypothetical protein
VVITSSAAVFLAGDVGRQIWKKPNTVTGVGFGKAVITTVTSPTEVTVTIAERFDLPLSGLPIPIPPGQWYFTASVLSGMHHLNQAAYGIVADGKDIRATIGGAIGNGSLNIQGNYAVVHVGIPYEGRLVTHNLELGGRSGPAQAKPHNISALNIRFLHTLGGKYGTDFYNLQTITDDANPYTTGRPAPVFSGVKSLQHSDSWITGSGEKNVVVVQDKPYPCVVQFIDIEYETGDE